MKSITQNYNYLYKTIEPYKNSKNTLYVMDILIGSKYKSGGTILCGRAPFGTDYDIDTSPEYIFNTKTIENDSKRLKKIVEAYAGTGNGFWPSAKALFEPIYGKEWYEHIAYTNYYKISPVSEEEANPPKDLADAQYEICNRILDSELDYTDAGNLILFTGCNVGHRYDIFHTKDHGLSIRRRMARG